MVGWLQRTSNYEDHYATGLVHDTTEDYNEEDSDNDDLDQQSDDVVASSQLLVAIEVAGRNHERRNFEVQLQKLTTRLICLLIVKKLTH